MKEVLVERSGAVTVITINRLHRRNAINKSTADALREAWLEFDADETQRVAILTGGDEVFCAGADLKELDGLDTNNEYGPLGFTHLQVSKPTIAAIAGYAVAGGLEIACWCDLRIADKTAIFGFFERRFGVPLVDGGTQRLPQIIGLGRALDLILTGRPVSADEAKLIGLVTDVVPRGLHLDHAMLLAQQLAEFPQICMNNDRKSVYQGLDLPLNEGLKLELEIGRQTLADGEATKGAKSFSEGKGRGGSFSD